MWWWWFKKKPLSEHEQKLKAAYDALPDAVNFATDFWVDHYDLTPPQPGEELRDRISCLRPEFRQEVRREIPELDDDAHAYLVHIALGLGIIASGTHTKAEVDALHRYPLPVLKSSGRRRRAS